MRDPNTDDETCWKAACSIHRSVCDLDEGRPRLNATRCRRPKNIASSMRCRAPGGMARCSRGRVGQDLEAMVRKEERKNCKAMAFVTCDAECD